VHFGRLPDDLRRKADAVARLDAAFIAATRPGVKLKEIFIAGIGAYARAGYPDEWTLHHQGGVAGYEPREFFATPTATFEVASRQVYAWNPSITGAKSEDSILVNEAGFEVLTRIDGWPMLVINQDGKTIERPAILELD
jgi:antitoxin VapB